MGLLDFLFGKKPSSKLPPWLTNIYNNPAPEYLQYLQTGMIPPSTSTSGNSSTTNSSGLSQTKGATTSQSFTKPVLLPGFQELGTLARDTAYQRLKGGSLPEGILQEGLRNAGQANSIQAKSLEDALTQRGLGRMTAAGQDILAASAADQNASFLNSLPSMAYQNQAADLGLAQSVIGQMGLGVQNQSAGTNQSTTKTNNMSTTDSSGWSTNPGGFDYTGYGNLLGSLQSYYNAPRQGGVLNTLLPLIPYLGNIFGGKSKSQPNNVIWGSGIGG